MCINHLNEQGAGWREIHFATVCVRLCFFLLGIGVFTTLCSPGCVHWPAHMSRGCGGVRGVSVCVLFACVVWCGGWKGPPTRVLYVYAYVTTEYIYAGLQGCARRGECRALTTTV